MRINEILTELQSRGGFLRDEYKFWVIAAHEKKTPTGKHRGAAHHKKYVDQRIEVEGTTPQEVLQLLRQEIDKRIVDARQGLKNAKGVAIDFNAEFTRQIFEEIGDITAARFVREGDQTILEIMDPEWYEELGSGDGFIKIGKRTEGSDTATTMYGFSTTINKVDSMDLEANGRYTVEQQPKTPGDPAWRYAIDLHSIAHSKDERVRLPSPGFNVAVY